MRSAITQELFISFLITSLEKLHSFNFSQKLIHFLRNIFLVFPFLLHPVDSHIRNDRSVIALDDFAFLAVKVEFRVEVLALAAMGDEVVKSGAGVLQSAGDRPVEPESLSGRAL